MDKIIIHLIKIFGTALILCFIIYLLRKALGIPLPFFEPYWDLVILALLFDLGMIAVGHTKLFEGS